MFTRMVTGSLSVKLTDVGENVTEYIFDVASGSPCGLGERRGGGVGGGEGGVVGCSHDYTFSCVAISDDVLFHVVV